MAAPARKAPARKSAARKAKGPDAPVVFVTGGARGLGRAMALGLAEAGAKVMIAELPSSAAEVLGLMNAATAKGIAERIHFLECDVTSYEQCAAAVAETRRYFRAIHGVVNNAAVGMQDFGPVLVGERRRFHEHDASAWRRAIDVNVNGPFNMAKAIAPALIAQGWGRIVNIETSTATMTMQGFSPYGPSKAALEAATLIWSKDMEGTGVTVNALAPGGAANTRMIPAGEPVDRASLVQPIQMVAPIVWLMSTQSDGVNGRRIIAKEWTAERLASTPAGQVGVPAGWG